MSIWIALKFKDGWRLFNPFENGYKRYINLDMVRLKATTKQDAMIEIEDLNNGVTNV